MIAITWSDAFSGFSLLLAGLVLVTAMYTPLGWFLFQRWPSGRSPSRIDVRRIGRLPARLYRIENRGLVRPMELSSGRRRVREWNGSGLEVCARQFEKAIQNIQLRSMDFRGRVDQ
jgi:hypothetical protein